LASSPASDTTGARALNDMPLGLIRASGPHVSIAIDQ
jgi:hypothetical protein